MAEGLDACCCSHAPFLKGRPRIYSHLTINSEHHWDQSGHTDPDLERLVDLHKRVINHLQSNNFLEEYEQFQCDKMYMQVNLLQYISFRSVRPQLMLPKCATSTDKSIPNYIQVYLTLL